MKELSLDDFLLEIRMIMHKKKITQQDLATAIGISGTAVSQILAGKHGSFSTVRKICEFVNKKEI